MCLSTCSVIKPGCCHQLNSGAGESSQRVPFTVGTLSSHISCFPFFLFYFFFFSFLYSCSKEAPISYSPTAGYSLHKTLASSYKQK